MSSPAQPWLSDPPHGGNPWDSDQVVGQSSATTTKINPPSTLDQVRGWMAGGGHPVGPKTQQFFQTTLDDMGHMIMHPIDTLENGLLPINAAMSGYQAGKNFVNEPGPVKLAHLAEPVALMGLGEGMYNPTEGFELPSLGLSPGLKGAVRGAVKATPEALEQSLLKYTGIPRIARGAVEGWRNAVSPPSDMGAPAPPLAPIRSASPAVAPPSLAPIPGQPQTPVVQPPSLAPIPGQPQTPVVQPPSLRPPITLDQPKPIPAPGLAPIKLPQEPDVTPTAQTGEYMGWSPVHRMANDALHYVLQKFDIPGVSKAGVRAPEGTVGKLVKDVYGKGSVRDLTPQQITDLHDFIVRNKGKLPTKEDIGQ